MAIDLSEWWDIERKEKLVICHMIDEFSRLSSAGLGKTKEPQANLQSILHEWISKYGPPKILLSDNGREFINDDIRCFLDRINVRHINTAAFAPLSNGIVERHNGELKRTMDRLSYDEKTKSMTANTKLSYAIWPKTAYWTNMDSHHFS